MQCYTIIFILLSMLYMFTVVFPPIIRSSKNCIYSIGYCQAFLLPAASVGELEQLTHASDRQRKSLTVPDAVYIFLSS
jgi:hypothetical protein